MTRTSKFKRNLGLLNCFHQAPIVFGFRIVPASQLQRGVNFLDCGVELTFEKQHITQAIMGASILGIESQRLLERLPSTPGVTPAAILIDQRLARRSDPG